MLADLLPDACRVLTRATDTSGRNHTETWTDQAADTPCRALIRIVNTIDPEKAQRATVVRARFVVPVSAVATIRDRVRHKGRVYEVVQVNEPYDRTSVHHKVIIAEAVAGTV